MAKVINVSRVSKQIVDLESTMFAEMRNTLNCAVQSTLESMLAKRADRGAVTLKINFEADHKGYQISNDDGDPNNVMMMGMDYDVASAITERTSCKGKVMSFDTALGIVDGSVVALPRDELEGQMVMNIP